MLNLSDVTYGWPGRRPFTLHLPEFSVAKGEAVLLLGRSGSGKSTLLSLICGTVQPSQGDIHLNGQDLAALSGGARDRFRAETMGVIFQQFNLLPYASVADNITLPLRFAPARQARAGDARAAAFDLCTALGLPEALFESRARDLSVGQQQRVAVARALIGRPPMIVADEPTSALDEGSQSAFLDLMFAQIRQNETTLLMVSHDPRLAERFDRVVELEAIAQIERAAA